MKKNLDDYGLKINQVESWAVVLYSVAKFGPHF